MGVSIAAAAKQVGHDVFWASAGRSDATKSRADGAGLRDVTTVAQLSSVCSLLVSVCPPHAAEELARDVAAAGFRGLFVDANAISPARAIRIARVMADAGADFVDGGIIGGPVDGPGETCLYVSGPRAADVVACFAGSDLRTELVGDAHGTASALKMCYAGYTKGSTALLSATVATAERLGVREALFAQWDRDDAGSAERAANRVRRVTRKAWRFAGEMDEIAATFADAGVPDGFHLAAGTIYRRTARYKDVPEPPSLDEVLQALLRSDRERDGGGRR
jgi:3-hydroxyisobutyrate dehydrogenase-like beta-hydroxyacid dehydrogenase